MEVATAPRLTSVPQEESDNEHFVSPSEAMRCFERLLDPAGGPLENATNALPDILFKFLRVIGKDTKALLQQYLRDSDLFRRPEMYEKYQRQYPNLDFNEVLFLIDDEFLQRDPLPLGQEPEQLSSATKIKIIRSSIVWMDEMFPAAGSHAWKTCFAQLAFDTTQEDLNWLLSIRQREFLLGHALEDEEEIKLDRLLWWFRGNQLRPIRLAFSMARKGMLRNVEMDTGRLDRIIGDLKEKIRSARGLGPTQYL